MIDLGDIANPDWHALQLSLLLAALTTAILLLIGTPMAWWLSRSKGGWGKRIVEATIALPLVLPPTVLGFYLLIFLGPHGWLGQTWISLTDEALAFRFSGLVIASVIYSLPFVVQPLQRAFESIGGKPLEAAATLGATPWDSFVSVAFPMARGGYLTAGILGFAHTLGEFGVVLMVGGNIPGKTQVISIAIYDHVESMEYSQAHTLSALLLALSFTALIFINTYNRRFPVGSP
ncbi:MAG: molybdate ABC transporter permease subunit [Magnetococcales bacterium]|nr:molybdate ABC transporter permease subunit [Magnetococcales bacterium]